MSLFLCENISKLKILALYFLIHTECNIRVCSSSKRISWKWYIFSNIYLWDSPIFRLYFSAKYWISDTLTTYAKYLQYNSTVEVWDFSSYLTRERSKLALSCLIVSAWTRKACSSIMFFPVGGAVHRTSVFSVDSHRFNFGFVSTLSGFNSLFYFYSILDFFQDKEKSVIWWKDI